MSDNICTDTLASHHSQLAPLRRCLHIFLKLTFARPIAFHPCVLKVGVVEISALAKPSPTTTATTGFAEFVGATLGTSSADERSRSTAGRGDVGLAL